MIQANELRIGNIIKSKNSRLPYWEVRSIDIPFIDDNPERYEPMPLTEEWLFKFGFSVINESSAGKRYGYVIDGVFSSDLTFTFWKTTKEAGNFFRGDLQLKSIHQIQNLYFALTNTELQCQ